MNLLLLEPEELVADGADAIVELVGRRAIHATEVLRLHPGEQVRVGVRHGRVGLGEVLQREKELLRLRVVLDTPPPERPGIDLLLAIPRPKALKKVLPSAASLGVDRIVLVNAARVEKSYFDSKVLNRAFLDELLSLGLEQARDTRPPEVLVRERFRPFVEDELDAVFGTSTRLLPHPPASKPLREASVPSGRAVLAIGPEGGWVPFEVELLQKRGFLPVTVGPRILRVETAVPLLVGQVSLLKEQATAGASRA